MTELSGKDSLEQTLRPIRSEAARVAMDEFWKTASEMRLATAGANLDSTDLIGQARDEH